MNERFYEKEFEEGRTAGAEAVRSGNPPRSCPYDRRTRSGRAWKAGWQKGVAESEVGKPVADLSQREVR